MKIRKKMSNEFLERESLLPIFISTPTTVLEEYRNVNNLLITFLEVMQYSLSSIVTLWLELRMTTIALEYVLLS